MPAAFTRWHRMKQPLTELGRRRLQRGLNKIEAAEEVAFVGAMTCISILDVLLTFRCQCWISNRKRLLSRLLSGRKHIFKWIISAVCVCIYVTVYVPLTRPELTDSNHKEYCENFLSDKQRFWFKRAYRFLSLTIVRYCKEHNVLDTWSVSVLR